MTNRQPIKEHRGNCDGCNSAVMTHGALSSQSSNTFIFEFGELKLGWYLLVHPHGVEVSLVDCCTSCGLVRARLDTDRMKQYIRNICTDEYEKKILSPGFGNTDPGCLNCGARKKISGDLTDGDSGDLFLNPGHVKRLKFITSQVRIGKKAECCMRCGYVFTHVDSRELYRFILKNCEPEFAMRVYSYME